MRKKTLFIVLCLLSGILTLGGCGKSETDDAKTQKSEAKEEDEWEETPVAPIEKEDLKKIGVPLKGTVEIILERVLPDLQLRKVKTVSLVRTCSKMRMFMSKVRSVIFTMTISRKIQKKKRRRFLQITTVIQRKKQTKVYLNMIFRLHT